MNMPLLESIKHRLFVAVERSLLKSTITRSIVSLSDDEPKIPKSPYLQFLGGPEKNAFSFSPPMLLEQQNYQYLKSFTVAQRLQTRKAQLIGSMDEPDGRFFVSKNVLCSVPLGCFNFTVDNRFPDENSLQNWLEIMERAVESESLHYEHVSLALIGVAKIQIASGGKFAQKIGWPLLVRWFSYVYERLAEEKRPHKFRMVYDNACRSAYRLVINGDLSQVKLEDFAEIKRLTSDLLPKYCDYSLATLNTTHRIVHSGNKKDISEDYLLRRKINTLAGVINVLWQTEFAFRSTLSLLDDEVIAQISKYMLEVTPEWIDISGYRSKRSKTETSGTDSEFRDAESYGNESKSSLPKYLFLMRSAYVKERWNVGDCQFWRNFFQNPSEKYEEYIGVGSERVACYYVTLAVRILLRGRNFNRTGDEDGTYEIFLRDILKPFVKSHLPTSVNMSHRCEIERLDDIINNYDVSAERFVTSDDLRWLKKCVNSYNPPVIVRRDDF